MTNEIDVLLSTVKPGEKSEPFDKASWAEKKQAERSEAYILIDRTVSEITGDETKFKTYLDVQSRFDRYSVSNALLITAQMPQAKRLGDFDYWKENGAAIKKLQKGITILEPGEEYTRPDGQKRIPYHTKKVFDISQTTLPEQPEPEAARDERQLLKTLIAISPVPIKSSEELPESVNAWYMHEDKVIQVRAGLSYPELFKALSCEIAHAEMADACEQYNRWDKAFKATCVSYILCKKHGYDVGGFSFSNLPDVFGGMTTQQAKVELAEIRDTVSEISFRMVKQPQQSRASRQTDER